MNIPKKVVVGQLKCPIIVKRLDENYGDFDRVTQVINISDELPDSDIVRLTLLHELVHAMETNNTAISYLTEPQVDNIANGLYSLIKDNKKLVEWIQNV